MALDNWGEALIVTTTIASGAATSSEVVLKGQGVSHVSVDGWTSADMSFLVCYEENGTVRNLMADDGQYKIASSVVAATDAFVLDPSVLGHGIYSIRIQSGVKGAQVNQTAARTVTIRKRPY